MTYEVYFASNGVPATGLAPVWYSLKRVSDRADYTPQPVITEVGGGTYKFDWAGTVRLAGVIDGGSGLADLDRYVDVHLSPEDGNLDASVSSRALETTAQEIKAGTDKLPDDPASESSLAAINGIVTDTRRVVKNKLTIDPARNKLQLWNDTGTTILYEWPLTDKDGNTITLPAGYPANRGIPG